MLIEFVSEVLSKSLSTILTILAILIPLMILTEYLRHFGVLEKYAPALGRLTKILTVSPEAALPLVVGFMVGVTYGAAVIIDYTRQGVLSKRDMMLCGVFLAINHSFIEDNLIFAALGANIIILFILRLVMAILVTRCFALLVDKRNKAATLTRQAEEKSAFRS